MHVLNGEKYREICPDNTLLSHSQLKTCVIAHHTKALLRRDGAGDDQLRCFLQVGRAGWLFGRSWSSRIDRQGRR